jgi:para-nitrobenzyl esterase
VAGESAGSVSVSLLTCAPAARGLFSAAIMQSGSYTLNHGPEVSQEIARSYARHLGLGRSAGRRLWELPAEQLLSAQRVVDRATYGTVPAAPWFDGDLVPDSLEAAHAAVRPDLPLLAGHTRDEVTMFQWRPGEIMPTRRGDLVRRLRAALGWEEADALLRHYPDTAAGTRALGTDLNFAMPTMNFAERHSRAGGLTFCYRFDAGVPVLGATHASELVGLWQWSGPATMLLAGRPTADRQALGARMRQHWVDFVREGTPGDDWPEFALPERQMLVFDPAGDRVEWDPAQARRIAWAGRDVLVRA